MSMINAKTQHKYMRVAAELRRRIATRSLRPGDRLPSFAELGEQFSATAGTIDRALVDLERDGLISRQNGRGLFVAKPQSRPRTGVVGCVGFDFGDLAVGYYRALARGIQNAANRLEMRLLLMGENSADDWTGMDGVIIHAEYPDMMLHRRPHGMPAVSVLIRSESVPSVAIDEFEAGFKAAQYLMSLGHKRIGTLMDGVLAIPKKRLNGFHGAVVESGSEIDRDLIYVPTHPPSGDIGYDDMLAWIDTGWERLACTAILCQNDTTARGVIRALAERGIRVPEDVSVMGFDGADEGDLTMPSLTSLKVPLTAIGETAMDLIATQLSGTQVGISTLVLPTHVRPGLSTAPPTSG